MPSLPDTAVIIFLGLLLFGPKGLAQIARQLGKLMGEFRRASNDFRMQMEEELRVSEQADRQKQIAAIEAAAPVPAPLPSASLEEIGESHPHIPSEPLPTALDTSEPLPIASSGELSIMPPSTGLPTPRVSSLSSLSPLLDSVPKMETEPPIDLLGETSGTGVNGPLETAPTGGGPETVHRPMRYTNHAQTNGNAHPVAVEESLHG